MRDIRDFKAPETVVYTSSLGSRNESKPNRQLTKSFRSDIVKTTPNAAGAYFGSTSYDALFLTTTSSAGRVSWRSTLTPVTYNLQWTGGEIHSSVWRLGLNGQFLPDIPSWAISQVRSQMLNQVLQGIDVSQLVGEANQTVSSLAVVLGAAAELFRAFKRRDWARYTSSTLRSIRRNGRGKTAAQAYLAWIYGFKPVIEDSVRIIERWNRVVEEPVGKRIYAEVSVDPPQFPVQKGFSYEGSIKRGVKSGATVFVLQPDVLKFSQLGLLSPLSVAWELTTLSFVVDWFIHVGAFLRTWEGASGTTVRGYYETRWALGRFTQVEDRYVSVFAGYGTQPTEPYDKMRVGVNYKAMNRLGSPMLLPSPPYISWGVDSSRGLSLFALFLARSKPVWEGDPAKVRLANTFLRGFV